MPLLAGMLVDHHVALARASAAAAAAGATPAGGGAPGAAAPAAGPGSLPIGARGRSGSATGGGAGTGAAALPQVGPEPNAILEDVEFDFPDPQTKAKVCQALRGNEVARRLLEVGTARPASRVFSAGVLTGTCML